MSPWGEMIPFDPFDWRPNREELINWLSKEFESMKSEEWKYKSIISIHQDQLKKRLKEMFDRVDQVDEKIPSEENRKKMILLVCTERTLKILLDEMDLMVRLMKIVQDPTGWSPDQLEFILTLTTKIAGSANYYDSVSASIEKLHLIPVFLKLIKSQARIEADTGEFNEKYLIGLIRTLGNLTEEAKSLRKEDSIRMFQKVEMLLKICIKILLKMDKVSRDTYTTALDLILHLDQFMQDTWRDQHSKLFTDPKLIENINKIADASSTHKKSQSPAIELMGDIARVHYKAIFPHFPNIIRILKRETNELVGIIMRAVKVFAFLAVNSTLSEKKRMLDNGGMIITKFQNSSDPTMEADACMALSGLFEHEELIARICTTEPSLMGNMVSSFLEFSKDDQVLAHSAHEYVIKHLLVCFLRCCTDNESLCILLLQYGVILSNMNLIAKRMIPNHTIINCLGFHVACYTQIPTQMRNFMNSPQIRKLNQAFEKRLIEYEKDDDQRVSNHAQEYKRIYKVHTNYGPEAAKRIRFTMQLQRREHEKERGVFKCEGCDKLNPTKKCSRCKAASYCSRECQVKEWPNHKSVCKTSN